MFIGFDPLYLMMMIPVIIISAFAAFRVRSTFKTYSKVASQSGKTGADVARELLQKNGINDVNVEESNGFLGDHYDPSRRLVRLSPQVFRSNSVAALGVAAHETGHAIQHKEGYFPLNLRNLMVPLASFGSNFAWIIIIAGFFLRFMGLIQVGILLFAVVVIFQLITLPVEFNASKRASHLLLAEGVVSQRESAGVKKVLNAAAMTYVAAALSSVVTLLYFIMRSRR